MWRGPVVQARKDAVNAQKWKIFSTHAKLISIAAQKWWDPDQNPSLMSAINTAKKAWVPNDNIDRAIKKGTWEDKSAAKIEEIIYEWYAPGWVALMVQALSDNKNRTVSSIRHIFSKFGWNMWESWSVNWMFNRKWVIFIDPKKYDYEKIEELAIEWWAEDIIWESSYIKILTEVDDFSDVEKFFEDNDIEILESKLDFVPDNEIELTDFDKVLKFTKMIEAFNEDEDVSFVSSNELISDDLQNEVNEYIEKHTFKS